MPTFLRRSAALRLLTACLALWASLLAGSALAEETQAASPSAKDVEQVVPQNRMNWPSAWSTEVTEADARKADSEAADGEPVVPPASATSEEAAASPSLPDAQPGSSAPSLAQAPQLAPAPANETGGPADTAPTQPSPQADPAPTAATPQLNGAGRAASPPASEQPVPVPATPAVEQNAGPDQTSINLRSQVAKEIDAAKSAVTRLDSVAKSIERVRERDDELTELLPTIETIIEEAKATQTKLLPSLSNIRSLIEKLGPAPSEGKTEAEDIAALRKRLAAVAAEIDGAVKTTELTDTGGRQLIARIQEIRLEDFRSGLSERSLSILSPEVWSGSAAALPDARNQLVAIFSEWASRLNNRLGEVLIVIFSAFAIGLGLQVASRRVRVHLRNATTSETPTFSQRTIIAGLDAPLRMLPKIVAATILFIGLNSLNLLYLQIGGLAAAALKAIIIASAGLAFTTAYLQPDRPNWRVFDAGDSAAWQIRRIMRAGIAVFAVDVLVRQLINELALPLPVNILWTSLASLVFAAIFIFGARVRLAVPESSGVRLALLGGHVHKVPLLLAVVAIVISVLTGYVALGHFIATRLLILAAAVFLLIIFYLANRAIAREPDQNHSVQDATSPGDVAPTGLPLDIRRKVARGLSIVLDIVLFVIAVPVLLIAIGFSPPEISTLLRQAVFGFVIGGVEISLFKVGIAVGLFAGLVFASRMLQRWLGDTVLHPSRTEQGLGNSIRTGVGYLGFLVAAIAGLSYAGLDITNLAIVAGALSVGIGFGLQSIVNNFVSGLILLVERPIKVGDLIKVADLEGYVRKISVRSTEIETFERASVIIPNSELISGTVVNMTLRNALGRVSIPIGVSYDSDPEFVQQLLLECALECDKVARHPAPFVVFEDFGSSSLDFSLRIFIADVTTSLSTRTQVRNAIFAKFREAGIKIPFPQQDLNLRDTDGLKAALAQLLDERQVLEERQKPKRRSK